MYRHTVSRSAHDVLTDAHNTACEYRRWLTYEFPVEDGYGVSVNAPTIPPFIYGDHFHKGNAASWQGLDLEEVLRENYARVMDENLPLGADEFALRRILWHAEALCWGFVLQIKPILEAKVRFVEAEQPREFVWDKDTEPKWEEPCFWCRGLGWEILKPSAKATVQGAFSVGFKPGTLDTWRLDDLADGVLIPALVDEIRCPHCNGDGLSCLVMPTRLDLTHVLTDQGHGVVEYKTTGSYLLDKDGMPNKSLHAKGWSKQLAFEAWHIESRFGDCGGGVRLCYASKGFESSTGFNLSPLMSGMQHEEVLMCVSCSGTGWVFGLPEKEKLKCSACYGTGKGKHTGRTITRIAHETVSANGKRTTERPSQARGTSRFDPFASDVSPRQWAEKAVQQAPDRVRAQYLILPTYRPPDQLNQVVEAFVARERRFYREALLGDSVRREPNAFRVLNESCKCDRYNNECFATRHCFEGEPVEELLESGVWRRRKPHHEEARQK